MTDTPQPTAASPAPAASAPAPKPAEPAADLIPQPTAAEQLRAFEDKVLGKDVPRINGAIERGIGSKFASMSPADKAAHAALERLVDADDRVTRAQAELDAAKLEQSAAAKAVQGHGNA